MNFQLHDILSNPSLLNHVPEETLQGWIKQYPYVALFQLYALKRKPDYTETDLHHTAFYFHNREKLYFLLNNKNQRTSSPSISYKQPAEAEIPVEAENAVEHIVLAESLPLSVSVPVEFEEKEEDIFPEDFSQEIVQEEIYPAKTEELLVEEKPS
jgi:hypothetical protein